MEFPGVGSVRPKNNLEKCLKLNWNFPEGVMGSYKKNPFHGGGMNICCNYPM